MLCRWSSWSNLPRVLHVTRKKKEKKEAIIRKRANTADLSFVLSYKHNYLSGYTHEISNTTWHNLNLAEMSSSLSFVFKYSRVVPPRFQGNISVTLQLLGKNQCVLCTRAVSLRYLPLISACAMRYFSWRTLWHHRAVCHARLRFPAQIWERTTKTRPRYPGRKKKERKKEGRKEGRKEERRNMSQNLFLFPF